MITGYAALAIGNERSHASALAAVAAQLSGEENAALLERALAAALAIGHEGDRAMALAAVAAQLSGNENAALLEQVLAASFHFTGWIHRSWILAALFPQMEKITRHKEIKKLLHQVENTTRPEVLDFCTKIFSKFPPNVETAERISESIIDICFDWRWL